MFHSLINSICKNELNVLILNFELFGTRSRRTQPQNSNQNLKVHIVVGVKTNQTNINIRISRLEGLDFDFKSGEIPNLRK